MGRVIWRLIQTVLAVLFLGAAGLLVWISLQITLPTGYPFGFRSGRLARKAARSAALSTLAVFWRETRGVGRA